VRTYQDIYPSPPVLGSDGLARASAAELLTCEYFQAEPAAMPTQVFDQHHILINLAEQPLRVENWRDGAHRDFLFHRDEVVVTPAGLLSGWRWHERSHCIVVTCEPDKLARFARDELGVVLTDVQLKNEPQFVDPDLSQAAQQLVTALQAGGLASAVMFESLARVFLVKLIERYGLAHTEDYAFSRSFTARHYRAVLELVQARYGDKLSLEDMAQAAGLSPFHFARLFKTTIGLPPYQFVMRYRVEQAQRRLGDPAQVMSDVALQCGFSDQAHFSRVFKSVTGQTPKAWRKATLATGAQDSTKTGATPSNP